MNDSSNPQQPTRAPDAQWHWDQGGRYALEGIRALILLNGGAAVALLTFVGSAIQGGGRGQTVTATIGSALVCFAVGACVAVFLCFIAYLAQLEYGNANDGVARRWHFLCYFLIAASIGCFVAGAFFARAAIIANLGVT